MGSPRDEHRVHWIVYDLIGCPKRRKKILVDGLKDACQRLLFEQCDEKGWEILKLAIQPEHIQLFVRVWPSDSASDLVRHCKRVTSRYLRQYFPHITRKLPALWTRSFFASTADNVSSETIECYIRAQS